jgi:hypothetical protein
MNLISDLDLVLLLVPSYYSLHRNKIDKVCTSEILVSTNQTTRCHNPEDYRIQCVHKVPSGF